MINNFFKKCSFFNADTGLLVLRIGISAIFILAGWEKVSNLSNTVTAFAGMGFGAFWAYLASFGELLGGIALLLGVYTRVAAFILSIIMVVAIYVVRENPSMIMMPVSVLSSSLALMFISGGKYSVIKDSCICGTCPSCTTQ